MSTLKCMSRYDIELDFGLLGHLGSFWAVSTPKSIFDPEGHFGPFGVISTSGPNFDQFWPLKAIWGHFGPFRHQNPFSTSGVSWGHFDLRTQFRPFSASGGHLGSFWAISTPKPIFNFWKKKILPNGHSTNWAFYQIIFYQLGILPKSFSTNWEVPVCPFYDPDTYETRWKRL